MLLSVYLAFTMVHLSKVYRPWHYCKLWTENNYYKDHTSQEEIKRNGLMKTFGYIMLGLFIFGCALALGLGTSWFGLVTARPMAQYQAESNRLTESNSRNRVDGVNAGIISLCLNMRSSADLNTKKAFANMLITDADSFQRQELLTDASHACISEARSIITQ
jgi:hypothetical protein